MTGVSPTSSLSPVIEGLVHIFKYEGKPLRGKGTRLSQGNHRPIPDEYLTLYRVTDGFKGKESFTLGVVVEPCPRLTVCSTSTATRTRDSWTSMRGTTHLSVCRPYCPSTQDRRTEWVVLDSRGSLPISTNTNVLNEKERQGVYSHFSVSFIPKFK